MSTSAPAQVVYLANEWERLYGSAAISGIVGDAAHAARGGYHISIQDQPSTNYSVIRADDKAPPGTWPKNMASAVDMTLSLADMKKCHARLKAAWQNRSSDIRMKYLNAWNGWDGNGSPGRYDVVTGSVSTASDDHKWHVHLEVRRKYINDRVAMDSILSILKGETLAEFLGDDMATVEEYAKAVWDYKLRNPYNDTDQAAGTILRYVPSRSPHDATQAMVNSVLTTVNSVLTAVSALPGVDVDEAALAAAMSTNPAFVDALATAIAAKIVLPGGSGSIDPAVIKAQVVEALNGTKLLAV